MLSKYQITILFSRLFIALGLRAFTPLSKIASLDLHTALRDGCTSSIEIGPMRLAKKRRKRSETAIGLGEGAGLSTGRWCHR